jgi:hypothetical protein
MYFQPTILLIPTRNDGIMEWWNNEIIAFHAVIFQGRKWRQNQRSFSTPPQAFICPKGAIPSFQSIVISTNYVQKFNKRNDS